MFISGFKFFRFFVLTYVFVHSFGIAGAVDCSKYKQEWYRVRYTSVGANILNKHLSDTGYVGSTCPVNDGPSCCDHRTEREMYIVAQRLLTRRIGTNWARAAEQMGNDSSTLETFLRTNVEQTRDRSHEFFSRIYGYNYKAHKRFFLQFFADLEAYIVGQRNQLGHLIDNFFNQLRDSIIALIERSGQIRSSAGFFSEHSADGSDSGPAGSNDEAAETRRIRCLSDRMAQMRPFDDVDVRLKTRMMEAYPPARMLVNTLLVGSRLLLRLMKQISNRPECIVGLARFQLCAICAAKPLTSVCPESCPKLMTACLSIQGTSGASLNVIWPRLIDAIHVASVRLERSFNFPAVNRHLQMEISEAITSLQTRYEQTKSKLESECRIGSSGRSVPALFSSSNSPNRIPQPSDNLPSLSGWPSSRPGVRQKRRSLQQFNRYHTSPDLLEWQTRQRNPAPNVGSFQSRPGNYAPPSAQTYGSGDSQQRPVWSGSGEEVVQNSPESLAHLTARIKRTYSTMKHLFSDSGSYFCPPTALNSPSNTTNSNVTDCWAPPDLTNTNTDQAILETLRLLSDSATRLNQAAIESADPDAVQLTTDIEQSQSMHHTGSLSSRFPESESAPAAPRSILLNQWNNQPRQDSFGPHDNPVGRNEISSFGSGTRETDWDRFPQPSQETVDQREAFSPPQRPSAGLSHPLQTNYPFPDNQPVDNRDFQGSGDGEYPPASSQNEYVWSPTHANRQPGLDETASHLVYPDSPGVPTNAEQPVESHLVSTDPSISTLSTTLEVSSTTTTLRSTTTSTTKTTTTVPTTSTLAEEMTIGSVASVFKSSEPESTLTTTPVDAYSELVVPVTEPPSFNVSRLNTTNMPDTTTQRSSLAPNPERRVDLYPESQLPSFNGFPDDEDTVQQPDLNTYDRLSSSSSQTGNQAWPGTAIPDRTKGAWSESSGSTRSESDKDTSAQRGSSIHTGVPPVHPEPPVSELPPYHSPGSGQAPVPDASLYGAQTGFNPPDAYLPEVSQPDLPSQSEWSNPSQAYAVPENSGLIDSGAAVWRDQGSGQYEPPTSTPPFMEPPRTPLTNPIIGPTVSPPLTIKPRPVLNHLFLPPPEIWVPAQMGPEHRFPSVLLVREYNIQDPFYHQETMQHRPNRASNNMSFFTPLLFVLFLFHRIVWQN